ncbi:RNA polymerase sigma factor [Nocardia testacea]|uniref:RNA polymerase sigma factor n=1 Tax=Nocardia testacea TaxID=248551 RepID=A0ABW7W1Y3_9NOCA
MDAVKRIACGTAGYEAVERFDELFLEAFDSVSGLLLGWVGRQVGNRLDAEDIVQTALMRVYAAKPEATTVAQLRAYLWTVTRNLVRDAWRRAAYDRERIETGGEERLAFLVDRAGLHFEDGVVLRHTLARVLDTLPRREREAVVLRAYAGNTYAETARIMGVSTGTAKSYVHDGLRRVRDELDLRA